MRMRTKAILAGAGAVALGLSAGAAGGAWADHGWMKNGGHHGMDHDRTMMRIFDRYDANGDGKVTRDELDQRRAEMVSEYDADGNGALSLDEYQELWMARMHERMVDSFQMFDDDGDASVTVEEFSERPRYMFERIDADSDGEVSRGDLRQMMMRHRGQGEGPRRGKHDRHHRKHPGAGGPDQRNME